LPHASLLDLKPPKNTCIEMNLKTKKDPKNIRAYSGLTPELLVFFSSSSISVFVDVVLLEFGRIGG
jgi:hypothetical protein